MCRQHQECKSNDILIVWQVSKMKWVSEFSGGGLIRENLILIYILDISGIHLVHCFK